MQYKNSRHKKSKNTFTLEVSCGSCKTPIVIYEKGGKGNLIKLQAHRIIESEFDLESHLGYLKCINRGLYKNRLTYFIIRGKINIKKLVNYKY